MVPETLAPKLKGPSGQIFPSICRLSPDLSKLAFWVPEGEQRGLYVGEAEWADQLGEAAERIWTCETGDLTELAWSGDGQYLALRLIDDGRAQIGVLRLIDRSYTQIAGATFAWAGKGATLLAADPASSRVLLKDLELAVEHRVAQITDEGDPNLPPVISVSPDQRRFALVTRRASEDATHVDLAYHDGRQWQVAPVTQLAGTVARILPFWTADSQACGLYVIDPEQHHTAMIAIPDQEGSGDVLYTSDTVDAVIRPAVHPDGRLIAFVRAHPTQANPTLSENRLVLLDPMEHAIAPITADGQIVGNLRWLDGQTLLVEGGPAVWTVKLRATEEPSAANAPEELPPTAVPFVRTTVLDTDASLAFSCEIPADWRRTPLPPVEVDLADPRTMRPLCLFGPEYASVYFTVAARPAIDGMEAEQALTFLAKAQGFDVRQVQPTSLRSGATGVGAEATQQTEGGVMRLRLVMIQDAGRLFSLAGMAPAPLWEPLRATLDQVIESFTLLDPKGASGPVSE